MTAEVRLLLVAYVCFSLAGCGAAKHLKGGVHSQLDESLTIVRLTADPQKYVDKEIVISVRYYRKGSLKSPLGEDYVNFIIADRVSYITLNKVWIKKDKAGVLDSFGEMETVVMKAKVFKIDAEKDPNLEALELVRE
jgi:hypothetical protein